MIVLANAKINLTLFVGEKQADGYHGISTLMQEISLCDRISLEPCDSDMFFVSDSRLPADNNNLCVKALTAFRTKTGIKQSVRISLEKHIPFMAGLGGGSSNAAAVLKALDTLFDTILSYDEMTAMAATIGSDVPFFIGGGCSRCVGRGEIIADRFELPTLYITVAKGNAGLSTPEMYRAFDSFGTPISDHASERIAHCGDISGIAKRIYNSFDDIACQKCPEINQIKQKMLDLGALGSMLCGSGSAVFGIFDSKAQSEQAADALRSDGYFAEACESV